MNLGKVDLNKMSLLGMKNLLLTIFDYLHNHKTTCEFFARCKANEQL